MATYVRPLELGVGWPDRVVSRRVLWPTRAVLYSIAIVYALSMSATTSSELLGQLFGAWAVMALVVMIVTRELSVSEAEIGDKKPDAMVECRECGGKTPAADLVCEDCGEPYARERSRPEVTAETDAA